MRKTLNKFDMESLIDKLRTFSYTTEVEGESVTVNVELFTSGQVKTATVLFMQRHGERLADTIMEAYGREELTATEVSDIIKAVCVQRWKHFLEMWKAEYNPIWNVDGKEVHTIVTQYGKVTTMAKNSKLTDEQKTNGSNSTQYGHSLTDNQTVAGSGSITHGKSTSHTNPTTTGKVAAFDSANYVDASQTTVTNTSDTDSGTDTTSNNMGTIAHTESGTDTVTTNIGKIEHAHSGSDTDTLSGTDTTTDTLVRGGNIGVTMTQQLLTAENNFWSNFSFFEQWFDDIAAEISLPMWG